MAKVGCKGERRGRRRQTVKRETPTLNLNGEPAMKNARRRLEHKRASVERVRRP